MTLFNADANIDIQAPNDDNNVSEADYLSELVGEGKKFKDEQALAKSVKFKDEHIAKLEREMANAREEISKRATLEEFLDKIESRSRTPNQEQLGEGDGNQEGATSLTPEAIKALVKQATLEERTQATEQQNLMASVQELQKAWGQNWQQKLVEKRNELGLSEEFMNSIAFKSPKALLNLVGVNQSPVGRNQEPNLYVPPRNQMANASDTNSGGKNKAYWDKMQKTDPILYRSAAMTAERHRVAQQMGRKFFE